MKKRDPINLSLKECKKLILEYQKTKDKKIFKEILIKLDKYLLYLIEKFKKYPRFYYYLKDESPQELYHISVIGLEKGICSLRKDWKLEKIYLWIGSYIKNELLRAFRYKKFEVLIKNFSLEQDKKEDIDKFQYALSQKEYKKLLKNLNLKFFLNSTILTDEERELLELSFIKGLSNSEIGKLKNLSTAGIWNRIKKILKKLKKHLGVDLENKILLLEDRVLIEPLDSEKEEVKGILIVSQEPGFKLRKGKVVLVGKENPHTELKEGDVVYYFKHLSSGVRILGKEMLIIREKEILAKT